ncbi:RidA family protein [Paraburkholderia sp. RP-4-7]|jgi:enamine deaminase RidA (YjgF/YER057c/UK114 family)|uniref:RidA family protein n=1 Tax=Paraburkholderia polaris TaxID=2728848 RepID=A0A848IQC6_9BURK|nr:RidA family protein [Paraburkholderia polaris]NMM03961.1 RidA family protein [Paraburkholderia polaris]
MSSTIAKPLAKYAPYKRKGNLVFLSGIIAVDPAAGKIVHGYEDVPHEVRERIGKTGEFSVDVKEGPIRAQSWYVLDRIRATIEAAGGSMADIFKLVQYFRDLRDYPAYNRVRGMFFEGDPPVSTVVQVSAMLPDESILVEVEATAWLPE